MTPGSSPRCAVRAHVAEQERVAQAVRRALMTDTELAAGLERWAGQDDGFVAWLGDYSEVA